MEQILRNNRAQVERLQKSLIRLAQAFLRYLWVTGLYRVLAKWAYLLLDRLFPDPVGSAKRG